MSMQHAGIDISAKTLDACASHRGDEVRTFENTAAGRKSLAKWLRAKGDTCRVVVEPTGIYSLDVALALADEPGLEVMVVNPRRSANFARVRGQRGKSDAMDAKTLLAFAQSMPFEPWRRPTDQALELRQLTRYIDALVTERTRVKNQLHAALATRVTPALVLKDLKRSIEALDTRIDALRGAALELVAKDDRLARAHELLRTIPGIAEVSSLNLLAELALLPDDMAARQWVAHAGLDPRKFQSGTTVRSRTRVSRQGNRYVRHALYMPAVVAIRSNARVAAFANRLVGRGKAKQEANVAVMRKLLHAIHGMIRSDQPWDETRFCAAPG